MPYLMPDGFHFPWGGTLAGLPLGLCPAGSGELFDQGAGLLLGLHADPLDAAALPLRPAHAAGLAGAVSDRGGQRRGDGRGAGLLREGS